MFIALVTVRGGAPAERDVHQPTDMLLLKEQNTSCPLAYKHAAPPEQGQVSQLCDSR